MRDVTGREADFTRDNSAFCYVNHGSAIEKDMMTMPDEEIEAKYYPETADLIQKL